MIVDMVGAVIVTAAAYIITMIEVELDYEGVLSRVAYKVKE